MSTEPLTVTDLARALAARAITSEQVTRDCLAAIAERNGSLNAFITVAAESALEQARSADAEIAAGRSRGPLHGVPVSVKDIIDVEGLPTTAASRVREGHVADRDAAVITRLKAAGAVIVGKTNLHEFALGTTNEDSAFGPARHPVDPSRSPGGSSGGSAVSIATSMAYASIGTDTGGSIRIPCAVCGLVGLKPTVGELPLDGVVPLSTTLDHVGPMCRTVADTHLLFQVLAGDASPSPLPATGMQGRRLGLLRPYFMDLLDEGVAAAFDGACTRLRNAGVDIVEAVVPHAADAEAIYPNLAVAEAAAYHADTLRERPEAYTPNVRLRLEMGMYMLAEDYVRALRGRDVLRAEVEQALDGVDALLLPSLCVPAPPLGAASMRLGGTDVPIRSVMLRLTQLFNISGHPAITIPCGATSAGLPAGAQLVGRHGETSALLQLAGAAEPHIRPVTSR